MAGFTRGRDGAVAFGGASLATALEALGRFAWNGPYLPELMAQTLFDSIPMWLFSPLLRIFGAQAKTYAFAGMVALEVGGLTLAGIALRRGIQGRWSGGGRVAAGAWGRARDESSLIVVAAAPVALVILLGILPALDAGVAGRSLEAGAGVAVPTVVGVALAYAAVLTRGLSP